MGTSARCEGSASVPPSPGSSSRGTSVLFLPFPSLPVHGSQVLGAAMGPGPCCRCWGGPVPPRLDAAGPLVPPGLGHRGGWLSRLSWLSAGCSPHTWAGCRGLGRLPGSKCRAGCGGRASSQSPPGLCRPGTLTLPFPWPSSGTPSSRRVWGQLWGSAAAPASSPFCGTQPFGAGTGLAVPRGSKPLGVVVPPALAHHWGAAAPWPCSLR